MAGDWIPVRLDLHQTNEVVTVAGHSSRDTHEVAGLLVHFWGWFSSQTRTSFLPGITLMSLTQVIGADTTFWKAVADVGWLKIHEDGLSIPKPGRWLGRGAKKRILATERKRRQRAKTASSNNKPRDTSVTKAGLHDMTEHDRREEKKEGEAARARSTERAAPEGWSNHPAVELYRQRFQPERVLAIPVQEQIESAVRDDLEGWRAVLDYWQGNDYRPESVAKMLDRYREQKNGKGDTERQPWDGAR